MKSSVSSLPQLSAGALHAVVAARRAVLTRPTLALTSISFCPESAPTHIPTVPLGLVPTAENPLGAKVNVLLAAERLALAATVTPFDNVLSRKATAEPLTIAIQRLPTAAEHAAPSSLGHTRTVLRLLMASERAICIMATNSLPAEVTRLPRIRLTKLGAAIPAMIAMIATVTINSITVKPCSPRFVVFRHIRLSVPISTSGTLRSSPAHGSLTRQAAIRGDRTAPGVVAWAMDQPPPAREHPIDILWQPATLLSIFAAGELLAIILALGSPLASGPVLVKFGLASFAVQWVVLFTLGGLYLLRGKLIGFGARGVIVMALTLMLAVTLLSGASASSLFGDLLSDQGTPWFLGMLRFYVCLLAMSAFGLLALRSHWSAQRAVWQAQQAELLALQARVDPHFLFNTLNTGVALVHARPDAAEQLLLDLADLFRAALAGPRTITLADELDLVRRYLDIEQLRFGPRLQVEWGEPEALPHLLLPALSIQPLVENAIHHGIEPRMEGGVVTVRVIGKDRDVVVEIDNPLPDASSSPRDRGHRVGQAAVAARLREAGGSFSAAIEGDRYVARVRIPLPRD